MPQEHRVYPCIRIDDATPPYSNKKLMEGFKPSERELKFLAQFGFYNLGLQRKTCITILGLYRRGILRKDLLQWLVKTWVWSTRWEFNTWRNVRTRLIM